MIHVDSVRVELPLKKKFATSSGEATVKTNVITVLNNRYPGEAAPSVAYGPSVEELEADINRGLKNLAGREKLGIDTLREIDNMEISPMARAALMGMTLNYLSGESKRYAWEILGLGTPLGVKSSITISVDESAQMIEAINNSEYPIIKIKMGHEDDVLLQFGTIFRSTYVCCYFVCHFVRLSLIEIRLVGVFLKPVSQFSSKVF